MIIVLRSELFDGKATDDLALLAILAEQRERHKIRLEPAYRAQGATVFHAWLDRQGLRAQEQIRLVLARGLKERDFGIPGGEPRVIVHRSATQEWPNSLGVG